MLLINKKSIGVCIFLSLITFGIYYIYWKYLLVKNTKAIKQDASSCTGEMLCLIFVPFYSLYWWFTRGKSVRDEFARHGYSASSNETVFIILAIFGLEIVNMAIIQSDFNSLQLDSNQFEKRSGGLIKKLAKSIREFKTPTILTIIFIVGEAIIETFIPFLTANMINNINALSRADNGDLSDVIKTGVLLAVMAVCSLACGGIAGVTCAKASAGFAKNLRSDIFKRVQMFSFGNIDKFSSASLVTRMTTDVSNVQLSFMMIIRTAIRSPLMFIFSVIMAYKMGGALATSFVVIIPVLVFGLVFIAKKAMPAFRNVFRRYDNLNESIEENVRGMRVVKGFAREEHEKSKFDREADSIRKDFTFAERVVALNSPLMQICMYFNMAFVLWIGSKLVITNPANLGVGELSAMLNYGMQVLMSLMMLSVIYVMITMSAESAKRICEVLDEVPDLHSPENAKTEIADGSVDFENVSFKYSASARVHALYSADLHIKSGMTVGILGGTGASKSSLVQLIPRLYDVAEGSVKVGGVDVREYDLTALRDSVAMVLQKNLLFSGTIKENLRWGNPDATDEQLIEACKLAQADEFIATFPDGYDTKIEQGGTNVSGGQKQRLCIARALLKKPKILILDDSTSAVDTKTDALIRKGFKEFIPETTKIIIAQRVASVRESDIIVVMDNGSIQAIGTHDELLASNKIYKEIYEQQTNGGEDNEEQ